MIYPTPQNLIRTYTLSCLLGVFALANTDHLTVDAPKAQLFDGMGSYTWSITTDSKEAQTYFNQGIAWMHAFNHDEAIRSFAKAASLDPDCAMAWWAISHCEGPNYNAPVMDADRQERSWGALQEALERIDNASPLERDLIDALSQRYEKPWSDDRAHLEEAYADALAQVWAKHPKNANVGALYAEAMMLQRPWKLYSPDRKATGNTPEILETLEEVMKLAPDHPGVFHLYVHAVEPSLNPGRALEAADHLRNMMPGAGHMLHMPSHIYVQVGHWEKSIVQNAKAVKQDDRYRELSPQQSIQNMYMTHNAHMLAFSAMMSGREQEAMEAARKMWTIIPEEMLPMVAGFVDRWMSSVYDVQKRFGRWDAILAEPAPPEVMPITTAQWRAHRSIAFAAKKDFNKAEQELAAFRIAKAALPVDSPFGRDLSHKVLDVTERFVEAEIALQREQWQRAADLLEQAASIEDTLSYGEPPQFLQPARHTLGAVYMKMGEPAKAEAVYRKDLEKWSENGWSLYGLSRALAAQGSSSKIAESASIAAKYKIAWQKADSPTKTSCLCIESL